MLFAWGESDVTIALVCTPLVMTTAEDAATVVVAEVGSAAGGVDAAAGVDTTAGIVTERTTVLVLTTVPPPMKFVPPGPLQLSPTGQQAPSPFVPVVQYCPAGQ